MHYFLTLQNTYDQVELGLFSYEPRMIARCSIQKAHASKDLIPVLAQFLHEEQKSFAAISYLVVNQGPGPFTTLRVVITTANGLSFATGIPLIGVDALETARTEWHDTTYPITVIMFNAFAFDVYITIEKKGRLLFKGYKNIDQLLEELTKEHGVIRFMGNGATLYHDKITAALGNRAFIPQPNPDYCSLEQIGRMGYAQWQAGEKGVQQLLPLYLKQHPVQEKNPQ